MTPRSRNLRLAMGDLLVVATTLAALLSASAQSTEDAQHDDDHAFTVLRSFVNKAGGVADVKLVMEPGGLRGLAASRDLKKGDAVVLLPPGTYLTENMAPQPWKKARTSSHSLRGPIFAGTLLCEERHRRNRTALVHRQGWAKEAFEFISHESETESNNVSKMSLAVDFVEAYLSMLPAQTPDEPDKMLQSPLADEIDYSSPVSLLLPSDKAKRADQHNFLSNFEGPIFDNLGFLEKESLREWARAYYLTRSRVWSAGGIGTMLPIIDLLNHQPQYLDGNVEFAGCTEDFQTLSTAIAHKREGRHCLFKARHDISKDTVLHTNYGRFSNVQLLLKYAFTLPDNPNLAVLRPVPDLAERVVWNNEVIKTGQHEIGSLPKQLQSFNCSDAVYLTPMLVDESRIGLLSKQTGDDADHMDLFRCVWLHILIDENASQHELEITGAIAGREGPGPNASQASRKAAVLAAQEVAKRCAHVAKRSETPEILNVIKTSQNQISKDFANALLSQAQAAHHCVEIFTSYWERVEEEEEKENDDDEAADGEEDEDKEEDTDDKEEENEEDEDEDGEEDADEDDQEEKEAITGKADRTNKKSEL